jgi:hypothetical protein
MILCVAVFFYREHTFYPNDCPITSDRHSSYENNGYTRVKKKIIFNKNYVTTNLFMGIHLMKIINSPPTLPWENNGLLLTYTTQPLTD